VLEVIFGWFYGILKFVTTGYVIITCKQGADLGWVLELKKSLLEGVRERGREGGEGGEGESEREREGARE
jgi:hypothetical protein